ncbi:MAG: NYN domain-containing protein [Gemmatimonadota bacterium]|nr:NYN domain-containing protein [Gemmatimonadota bacterium]
MNNRHLRSSTPRTPVAPLHRGPQAAAHAAAGLLGTPHAAPNAALLIDFDNVTMGIRSDLQTELRNLLSSEIISGKVAVQRAYADWRRYPQYIVPLSESSIDLIFAPAYGSSKKNATDIRLAVDAMELIFTRPEIGTYILLSGDSDFSSLVLKLKEYGKYVIGVGIRESSSDLLVQNCDEYYSYNALAGLVKSSDETAAQKWDPWELVTEAIGRMSKNGDVMRSDRLKQVMQEIDPSFDEKNLGMSKFSRFCQEASHKGLIHVTKLENGQLEVSLPNAVRKDASRPADAITAPAAVAAAPRDEDEGGRRRGRRGGRGRGRDRERGPEPRIDGVVDAAPVAAAAPIAAPVAAPAAVAGAIAGAIAAPAAPAAPAAAAPAPTPHHRHERKHQAPAIDATIGVAGVRLTRDEAFSLVRRAVEALTTGDSSAMAEAVRVKARELLGRDSESLSDRNFTRILRDTHDAGAVDVRRRGDSFEVSRVEGTVSVADQLTAAEAQAKAEAPAAPAAPPAPRGVGATRGLPVKGGRTAKLPPSLLLLGVVDDTPAPAPPAPPAPVAAPVAEAAAPAAESEAPAKARRGKKPAAPKAEAAPKAAAAPKAKRATAKPRAKKA